MALMPPRRSARLSNGGQDSDGLDSSPLRSHSNNTFPATTLRASSSSKRAPASSSSINNNNNNSSSSDRNISSGAAAGVGNSSNTTTTTAQSTGKRRERRLEDIQSDDDDGDNDVSGDFMTGFARPVITGNAKHAASIPVPRQPRTTFREEIGEDGFIFSVTGPNTANNSTSDRHQEKATGSQVPGAKGPPPRSASAQRRIGSAGTASLRLDDGRDNAAMSSERSAIPATPAMSTGRRVSSSSVKAVRRVSLLRDGTPAYPHPAIADADLFQHCSSELNARDRLRHLTLWTLDRSVKKTLSSFEGSSALRSPLENAIRATLQGLSRGELPLEWPSFHALGASKSANAAAKAKQVHPRNEANRRAEVELEKSVEAMERENWTWQKAREDLQHYEAETERLVRIAVADVQLESVLIGQDDETEADELVLQHVRRAFTAAAPWLPTGNSASGSSASVSVFQTAREIYQREHVRPVPVARPFKRRRTTSNRGDETSNVEQVDAERTVDAPLRGTEADPRWHDVEWNVDQLRTRTHGLAQLARLSEHYTSAVSARGAQAIGELMGSARVEDVNAAAITSNLGDDGTSMSRVTREGQQTLHRILTSIRRIQRDDATPPSDDPHADAPTMGASKAHAAAHPGDVSDGDILRAFAGLRRQPQRRE